MANRQKILIVDDRPENLFALEKILNKTKAEIIKATSGNEALAATLNHEFALAILDVQMPEMDGYELAALLRSADKTSDLPIIFLTAAYSDEDHVFKGYESGGTDFITKPYDPRMLLGKVTVYLELGKRRRERVRHLASMETLVRVSAEVLAETSVEGLLRRVAIAARSLSEARLGACAHGCWDGAFKVRTDSWAEDACIPGADEAVDRGMRGVYFSLVDRGKTALRLSGEELRGCFSACGLEGEGLSPQGLLAAALIDRSGAASGLVTVQDKAGGDFTPEDETLLAQLATLASLGLQHLQARNAAEQKAKELREARDELELRVLERTIDLEKANTALRNEIEERKRAEEALRESEKHYRSIFVNSIDGILLTNPATGEILAANPAACAMLKGSEDEICMESRGKETGLGALLEEKTSQGRRLGEIRPVSRDGKEFPSEVSSGVFAANDGSPRATVVFRDITERKSLEQRIQVYMANLEKSNQALEDFASIASHDLQEPLRKIRVFSDRLRRNYKGSMHEEARDYLERMEKAAERMQELLNALLDYSRITTRKSPFRSTDLTEVVRDATSDMELALEQAGGRVEMGEMPVVEADATQLRQLFENLISNSLKYRREDAQPVIKVHGEIDDNACRIIFEDNGIGFDQKYFERIFQPFQRLHGMSSGYRGTGMGLAICRRIVERHAGSITARSAPGKGATFIITLPMRSESAARAPVSQPAVTE